MRYFFLCFIILSLVACKKESIPSNTENPGIPEPPEPPAVVECDVPHNELWYTTTHNDTTCPYFHPSLEHSIVSNTYGSEGGVMRFEGDITTIGYMLFFSNHTLSSITMPCSVTSIGESAFDTCALLSEVNLSANIEYIGKDAFYGCKFSEFAVPDKVTTIEPYTFGACKNLVTITLPEGLKKISQFAFTRCIALKSISIPHGVEDIESGAFVDCRSLEKFESRYATADGRCLIKDNTIIAFAPSGLTEYAIENGVTTIGSNAFAECKELRSVDIPNSVTHIGAWAFSACYGLESITIPDSVISMSAGCFSTYQPLVVYCEATTPPVAVLGSESYWRGFSGAPYPELTIYVPVESVDEYKSAEHWSNYADNIVGYDFENGVAVE